MLYASMHPWKRKGSPVPLPSVVRFLSLGRAATTYAGDGSSTARRRLYTGHTAHLSRVGLNTRQSHGMTNIPNRAVAKASGQQSRPFSLSTFLRLFVRYNVRLRNRFDKHRMQEIGAEMLCAEWLLQSYTVVTVQMPDADSKDGVSTVDVMCLGAVRFHGIDHLYRDLDFLPRPGGFVYCPALTIEMLDCSLLDVSDAGLQHIVFLSRLRELRLVQCEYITNEGMRYVAMVSSTLLRLSVRGCKNLTTKCRMHLSQLQLLEVLDVRDTALAKDDTLQLALPKCRIIR